MSLIKDIYTKIVNYYLFNKKENNQILFKKNNTDMSNLKFDKLIV